MSQATPQTVLVVGAGLGGITAAAHLAQQGLQVTVLEKNRRPGGRCDRISRDGHHFDSGPTLFVMPLVYEAEFAALGVSLRQAIDLQRVDPTYHLVFDDGQQLALTSDMMRMRDQLDALEPGSFAGYLRYLVEGNRHYHVAMERLVNRDFRSAPDFFSPANLPLLFQLKPTVSHYANMDDYFDEPRLKAAFTFQDVYMGLSPYEAPATFSLMPYSELAHGVWYPRGGMYSLVEALVAIAERAGVEFVYDMPVAQIEIDGGRARGVVLEDGRRLEADILLANADLPYVYQQLLPPGETAEKLRHKRYSCSTISFFWGVDKVYDGLPPHTLFLADDYRQNFDSLSRPLGLPDNPSLYLHAPARLDASMAPPGQDTLIAIVPTGHLDESSGQPGDGHTPGQDGPRHQSAQAWRPIRERARAAVFRRLALVGVTDLEEHIKFEVNYTPLAWRERYNLMYGATHGLAHTLTQLAYLRPANRHGRYDNLYFAGASTHPGTGAPSALISGRLVARRILEEQGIKSLV